MSPDSPRLSGQSVPQSTSTLPIPKSIT
ncbi:hypothetical protein V12B01_13595 [Vibrio splendidus 12B01]|nr:hypothetical protein V12B01_13595 [Vibrio splendidus 12B01]